MSTVARATLDDLYRCEGKAELIGGRIVTYRSTGIRPSEVASNIYVSLRNHVKQTGQGRVFNDNLGYAIPQLPSTRESFVPGASYFAGLLPINLMGFVQGPPTFAVEVRREYDYGAAAEQALAAKRADYFLAGTLIVWDVDPVDETISCYRHTNPKKPVVFSRGQIADAEPAVLGWGISVDEVFS